MISSSQLTVIRICYLLRMQQSWIMEKEEKNLILWMYKRSISASSWLINYFQCWFVKSNLGVEE